MCLYLDRRSTSETKKLKARKTPIRAYKVLGRKNGLVSPFKETKWIPGKTKTSNRRNKKPQKLSRKEIIYGWVDRGLHFYRTKNKALSHISFYCWSFQKEIWIVEIQPEDIITTGGGEIVAHKARLIKKIS